MAGDVEASACFVGAVVGQLGAGVNREGVIAETVAVINLDGYVADMGTDWQSTCMAGSRISMAHFARFELVGRLDGLGQMLENQVGTATAGVVFEAGAGPLTLLAELNCGECLARSRRVAVACVAGAVRSKGQCSAGRFVAVAVSTVLCAGNVRQGCRIDTLLEIRGVGMAGLADTGAGCVGEGGGAGEADRYVVDAGVNHHVVGSTMDVVAVGAAAAQTGCLVNFHVLHGRVGDLGCVVVAGVAGQAGIEAVVVAQGAADVGAGVVVANRTCLSNAGLTMTLSG